jgi:hypothetical protein
MTFRGQIQVLSFCAFELCVGICFDSHLPLLLHDALYTHRSQG